MNNEKALTLSKDRCKNCYKCIRSCPVKAIYFKENRTVIASDRCVGCSKCFIICPQKNKKIPNSISRVKKMMENDTKIIASLDPTFAAYFGNDYLKVITALRKLGFNFAEEVTVAIDVLHHEYLKIYNRTHQKHYITSACSGINQLVQKYYPELNKYMLAVDLPMIAHAKLIKEKYGENSKIIFVGPCTAAKLERSGFMEIVDAVLTFQELEEWIVSSSIDLNKLETGSFDQEGSKFAKAFTIEGFISINTDKSIKMNYIKVNGLENTKEILASIESDDLDPAFIEINFCMNGCIQGPSFHECKTKLFTRKKQMKQYSECGSSQDLINTQDTKESFKRKFSNKKVHNLKPNTSELSKILKLMGKYKESDEINCGTCGYDTCRDKAIAIFNDMDKSDMCLPYIRNKTETISNLIFENSPNYNLLVNRDLKVISINPAAINHLNIEKQYTDDLQLSNLLDQKDYEKVFETKKSICGKKIKLKQQNLTVIQNLLYIEEQDTILAILNDITKEEEKEQELIKVKKNTDEMVQKVIAKQMKVAQEICSVLGETTAETRVALKQFLDITLEKSGDS